MFDLGFWELTIIGVVALLVFGPERLPELARNLGRWLGRARQMIWSVRNEIERELDLTELKKLNRTVDLPQVERWLDEQSVPKPETDPPAAVTPPAGQGWVEDPEWVDEAADATPPPALEPPVGSAPAPDPDAALPDGTPAEPRS